MTAGLSLQVTPLSGRRPQRGPRPRSEETEERSKNKKNARTDVRPGMPGAPFAFKRLNDTLNNAIHTGYRSLLRSSSMHEPRGPPLEVVFLSINATTRRKKGQEREGC